MSLFPLAVWFSLEKMEEDTGAGGGYAACTWSGTCNNGVRKYFDEVFNESFMVDTRLIVSPMRLPFFLEP